MSQRIAQIISKRKIRSTVQRLRKHSQAQNGQQRSEEMGGNQLAERLAANVQEQVSGEASERAVGNQGASEVGQVVILGHAV